MADAEIRSMFDCSPGQNRQPALKALRPQRRWEYQQPALFARFRMKHGRSPEEHIDSMVTIDRGTRGQSPCPRRYGDRCLREQFSIHHWNQKLLRHEFRLCARNRPAPFAIFPEAIVTSRYRAEPCPTRSL